MARDWPSGVLLSQLWKITSVRTAASRCRRYCSPIWAEFAPFSRFNDALRSWITCPFSSTSANQPCLLIGGGKIALRKAELLVAAGAKLRVVAPQIDQNLAELVDHYDGELYRREAETSDLRDCVLMIAASDDAELNRRMAETARLQRVPVNVVDDRDACSVILPTIIDRSPVLVAISSGGESPVLSRTLRSRLEAELPTNFGRTGSVFRPPSGASTPRVARPR